jgi:hypothetical protein
MELTRNERQRAAVQSTQPLTLRSPAGKALVTDVDPLHPRASVVKLLKLATAPSVRARQRPDTNGRPLLREAHLGQQIHSPHKYQEGYAVLSYAYRVHVL